MAAVGRHDVADLAQRCQFVSQRVVDRDGRMQPQRAAGAADDRHPHANVQAGVLVTLGVPQIGSEHVQRGRMGHESTYEQSCGPARGAAQPGQGSSMTPPNGVGAPVALQPPHAFLHGDDERFRQPVGHGRAQRRREPPEAGDQLARRGSPSCSRAARRRSARSRPCLPRRPSSPRPCGRSCPPASCRRRGCPRNRSLAAPRSRRHSGAGRARDNCGSRTPPARAPPAPAR